MQATLQENNPEVKKKTNKISYKKEFITFHEHYQQLKCNRETESSVMEWLRLNFEEYDNSVNRDRMKC